MPLKIFYAHDFAISIDSCEAALAVHFELLLYGSSFGQTDGAHHHELRAFGLGEHTLDGIFCGVALHFLAAYGREGVTYAGKEQTEVLVDFGACADRASRIAARHFLLDGNGGRDALDVVAFRLVHASEELTGIGAQAFHVATLSFGIKGVESQTALAAAAQTGDDDKLASWYLEADVLQVIDPCPFYLYCIFHL